MTDRSSQCIITFDQEIREDDFKEMAKIFMSIRHVKSVAQLEPGEDRTVQMAHERLMCDWRDKYWAFYDEHLQPKWMKD